MKDWFVENGIEFNHKLIQIQTNPYSVVALADLKVGTTLCVIPKDSILSVKNTAIADLLEQEQLGGMLALAVAVLYEFSIGMESPWFGYLHRLKGRENIPLFWSQEQARYLQGTDVGNALKKLKSDLLMDFNETVLPLVEKYPILDRTYFQFETFLNVTSWITSRAFQVDDYHGDSMVPFADLFNHKTDGEHIHLETNADVCPHCGSAEMCGCELDDESVECSSVPELLDVDMSTVPVTQTLEIVVVRKCKKGSEIFNTYGQLSNSSMLSRYGFVERNNPYSKVTFSESSIIDRICRNAPADFEERMAFWEDFGSKIVTDLEFGGGDGEESETEDEDMESAQEEIFNQSDTEISANESLFCILWGGSLNFALEAFLTLVLLPTREFIKFKADVNAAKRFLEKIMTLGNTKSMLHQIKDIMTPLVKERLAKYLRMDEMKKDLLPSDPIYHAILLALDEMDILNSYLRKK